MMHAIDASPDALDGRLTATRKLIEAVTPVRQREALTRWLEVAERGPVSKRDLKPALFGRTLQFITLVEIIDEGTDFRHVIEGREVIRWFGKSGDAPFSALYTAQHLALLRSFYLTVQLTGRPNLRSFMVQSIEDEEMAFSQLVLPAMDDAGIVQFLMIVFDFPDPFRRVPVAPLRMHAPIRRLTKGTAKDTMLGDYNWR